MHDFWPTLLVILLIVVLATRMRMRYMLEEKRRQAKQGQADPDQDQDQTQDQTQTQIQMTAPPQAKSPANDKLASDHEAQLKQAFTLQSEINALSAEFAALQEGLKQSEKIIRECVILKEQLRIAQSYASELMRYVMAPFQDALSRPYYVPTQEQAAWALTAARLTLGFAKNRIGSIKSMT